MADSNDTAVNLREKELRKIPPSVILKCNDICSLDLSENPGILLQDSIGRFQHLRKLVLRNCKLREIPDGICQLTELKELDLWDIDFSAGLSPAIEQLNQLEKLNIGNCELRSLPDSIGGLKQLKELDLSGNDFSAGLNPAIGQLNQLEKLDIAKCGLRSLPDSIGSLKQLKELDLSNNKFSAGLNPAIGQLNQLEKLRLFLCQLRSLPDSIRGLKQLKELELSRNDFSAGLSTAIAQLNRLEKLGLGFCELRSLPDSIGGLKQLKELGLYGNDFSAGLNPAIGQLNQLEKLNIAECELRSLPDSIGSLKQLKELDLWDNKFSAGLNPAIGQLNQLEKLNIRKCELRSLPDSIGSLKQLKYLGLYGNDFSAGLNPAIGQLNQLEKLIIGECKLRSLPDSIGGLKQLKELELYGNDFSAGLNPAIGQLNQLEKLDIKKCELRSLSDSIGSLNQLKALYLSENCLTEYPSCTLRLEHLVHLDLSHQRPDYQSGAILRGNKPGISVLPIELADTNLQELKHEGNPVVEPPKKIWRQGLDAIKSYLREKNFGSDDMCPDTINMIGDVRAGKTSIAQSLVQRSPHPAHKDDRTRVMQQLCATFGEDGKLLVNINDFGGHHIYHAVIPIFLPTDGLVLLAYDMSLSLEHQKCTVRRWLLTTIAKCKYLRVIVVGTRCDAISRKRRVYLEKQMNEFVSSVLDDVKHEVKHHINHIEQLPPSYQHKEKVQYLRNQLSRFERADVSVVCLSCTRRDEGLNVLHDSISKKLRVPQRMPRRWFLFMKRILNASSNRPYLTWDEVQRLFKEQVEGANDDKDLVVILRYLVSTSQIFWLEHHGILKEFIFYSTRSILNICKDVLDHDQTRQWATQRLHVYSKDIELYSTGLVNHPFLIALLSDPEVVTVALHFLQNFNLISEAITDPGSRFYVIPSNLPAKEPPQMHKLQLTLDKCPNSIVIKLSFLGSMLPLSFLETSISSMLSVAKRLANEGVSTHVWRDGLIILYDSVCFAARRDTNVLVFAAFSERAISSPWLILLPIMKSLHENVTASWHGTTPACVLICPLCRLNKKTKGKAGEIEITFEVLTSEVQCGRANLMCPQCMKTVPLCLSFSTAGGMSVSGGVHQAVTTTTKPFLPHSAGAEKATEPSELVKKLRVMTPQIVRSLDRHSVMAIVDELLAAHDGVGLITDDHRQDVQAERTDSEKARVLLNIVCARGDEAILVLARALNSDTVKRRDLAALILEPTGK